MRRKRVSRVRWGLRFLLMGVLLCLGMGAIKSPDQQPPPPGYDQWMETVKAMNENAKERQEALMLNRRHLDLTLEAVEYVDFVVTPALLVQEAITDGVIMTYPEE